MWTLIDVGDRRFTEANKDFQKVLELKPGHSSGQKELEQSARAGDLLEQAIARFDAEEFDQAAETLEKVLDVSPECSQVCFILVPGFFL